MNLGNLIIFRKKQNQSSVLTFYILIDGNEIGQIESGEYFDCGSIEYGKHKLEINKKVFNKVKLIKEIDFEIGDNNCNLVLNIKMDAFNNLIYSFESSKVETEDNIITSINVLTSENKSSTIGREKYEFKGAGVFRNAKLVKQGFDYTVYTCKITYKSGKTEIKQVDQKFLNKYSDLVD